MERKSFAAMHCSIAQCLEVAGEWWSMLILRDAFFGVTRFGQFQDRLGISRNVLNQRLTKLVDAGILVKVPYSQHPPRYDYRLTGKGRDLWPVLTSMRQWGDKHAAPDGPPVLIRHSNCGQISTAVPTCSTCGEPMDVGDLRAAAGPGDLDGLAIPGSPSRPLTAKHTESPRRETIGSGSSIDAPAPTDAASMRPANSQRSAQAFTACRSSAFPWPQTGKAATATAELPHPRPGKAHI